MGRRIRTPWQKIMAASAAGRGLSLTVDEVHNLSCDSAIETRAARDNDIWSECPKHADSSVLERGEECPWCKAVPRG